MRKSPVWIYAVTVLFFLLVQFYISNPGIYPIIEGKWIPLIFFWIFDLSSLLIGWVWWKNGSKLTGATGLLLATVLAVYILFF